MFFGWNSAMRSSGPWAAAWPIEAAHSTAPARSFQNRICPALARRPKPGPLYECPRSATSGVARLRLTRGQRQGVFLDRKFPDALAGRGKDGVGHGRRQWRHARLARAAQGRAAFDQINLDLRTIGQADHLVVGEIDLDHGALVDGDLAVQRG